MRTFIVLVLVQVMLSSKPARADWLPVLSGPVARVVAAGGYAAVVRDGKVLILREDGGQVSHALEEKSAGRQADRSSAKQVAEQTLDRLEIPEIDRDSDYTDDLVDDESRLGQRRLWRESRQSAPGDFGAFPTLLAASAAEIWVATSGGIYRLGDDGGFARRFGREWLGRRMVVANRRVVVDKGSSLALLSLGDVEPQMIELASPAQQIAISPDGQRVAWASGTSIRAVGPAGETSFEATSEVVDLTFCDEALLVVLAHGLLAIPPDGRPEVRPAPPVARKLLCPAGHAMPWLAIGDGLWISSDQGRQWGDLPSPEGPALLDLAASDHRIWLATTAGLFASVDGTTPPDLRAPGAALRKSHGPARRSWLAWVMPKVALRAAASFSPSGHQVEGFAFAAFPLGSQSAPSTEAQPDGGSSAPAQEPAHPTIDLADQEANCLVVARRKAVELAMSEPERARSYVSRAGHAAWLPELRVLVSRRYGRSESLDINSSSTALSSPLGIDTVNDIRYEARATWDLGKLVFSSEELAAQAQALHMAELRRDIETTVNRLYFERRRLLVAPAAQRSDSLAHKIRSQEVEAELDALSAGAFGTCLAEKSAGAR